VSDNSQTRHNPSLDVESRLPESRSFHSEREVSVFRPSGIGHQEGESKVNNIEELMRELD
jgi:hypothetical protein